MTEEVSKKDAFLDLARQQITFQLLRFPFAMDPERLALVQFESFNSRLRDECLNEQLLDSLPQARQIIEAWRYANTRCVKKVRRG